MTCSCTIVVPGGAPRDVCASSSSTTTTADYVQPAVGANVTVNVVATDWMSPGQTLFVEGGGSYTATPLTATTVQLTNLGYTGNAAPGANIADPAVVSPGGIQGPAVTYQITFRPGGAAVAGQVYTTNAALNTAIAALIAAGGAVTVFLDGSANGNAVAFTASADYKNAVSFVCLDYANGAATQLAVSTAAGVSLRGVTEVVGGVWTCNTSTSSTFLLSAGSGYAFTRFRQFCTIDSTHAANAAISAAGAVGAYYYFDEYSFPGPTNAFPAINTVTLTAGSAVIYFSQGSGFLTATALTGTGLVYLYFADGSCTYIAQTTFAGAGGTFATSLLSQTWNAAAYYPIGASVSYLGSWYEATAAGANKNPNQQSAFWKPISRARYYNAGADLWYQLTGTSPYANAGTAGAEALTATSSVITNQPAPFGTAPIVTLDASTGEGMATAVSTKNPAAAAGTIWAWIRPGKQAQDAVIWGKFVAATGITASIALKIKFSTGVPVVHLRRTAEVADDTLSAPAPFALAPGALVLIAATYDGATLKLYVNGALAASQALAGTLANTALSLWAAGSNGLDDLEQYEGSIDDCGMDNTVFTQATIAKMAAAGQAWLS